MKPRRWQMNGYSIPKATLGRLPLYLQYLKSLPAVKGATISATAIAKGLSLGDVQVRKDLAANAVLVGAGKLGRALLDYNGFEKFGVRIVAGFDSNEQALQIGKSTKTILPIKDLSAYCAEHDVKLGIITVGQGSAQEVCDKLVASGIEAIWNFAPCALKVPSGVLLKQENLALSLAYLNNQISKQI